MGVGASGRPVTVRYDRDEPIPLLEEVLAELGGKLAINIELKLDLPRWWPADGGAVVAQTLAAAGDATLERVIVTSFDPRKLRAARSRPSATSPSGSASTTACSGARDRCSIARSACCRRWRLPSGGPAERPTPAACSAASSTATWSATCCGTRLVGAGRTLIDRGHGAPGSTRAASRSARTRCFRSARGLGEANGVVRRAMVAEVRRLVALGVDWIETDDPERLMELIG